MPDQGIEAIGGRALGLALVIACVSLASCGGGTPLLHPARTLPTGDVRTAAGFSGELALGSAAEDLARARELAAQDPDAPGTNPEYAKGALVMASLAPGIAPFLAARVGVGSRFEGGLAYTGRAVRADMRRSFDDDRTSWSLGLGLTAPLYGRASGTTALRGVELGFLRGYGADVPVLWGWRSPAGVYQAWIGARGGFERVWIERVSTEPKPGSAGPGALDATRAWAGGLAGVATGFRRLHVALELSVAHHWASGSYDGSRVSIRGVTLAPASALWWTF